MAQDSSGTAKTLQTATFIAVAALLAVNLFSWIQLRGMRDDMSIALSRLNSTVSNIQQQRPAAPPPAAAAQKRQGPDPSVVHVVRSEGAPSKGPAAAPITIVAFSDFECPFCGRVNPTMDRIRQVYGDQVRIAWKNLPLAMHPNAPLAAQASLAAAEQGKFWQYHDKLFDNQRALKPDDLKRYARELGLDTTQFNAALDSQKFKAAVDADLAESKTLGVLGTPAFFVNGRFLGGAQPFEAFSVLINAELQRLKLPVPGIPGP